MVNFAFYAVVLSCVYFASCEQTVVRGPLHDALIETLQSHPSIRKVTIDAPRLRRGIFYVPKRLSGQKKSPRRKTCRWNMEAKAVGDYAFDNSFVYMTTEDCAKYNEADWQGVFPCVFNRDTLTTTCNGELPQGANQEQWHVVTLILEPKNMNVPLRPAPEPRAVVATPFAAEPTLISLGGLGLAKTIQYTGVYSGNILLQSDWQHGQLHVGGQSTELSFDTDFALNDKLSSNQPQSSSVEVSWYAWAQNGKLVVDMLYSDATPAPQVAPPPQAAPPQGAPTTIPNGKRATVSYRAQDLSGYEVTIGGTTYTYRSNENGESTAMEPRLCPVLTLGLSCGIMRGVAEADKQLLGNITGFFLASTERYANRIAVAGNVLGTKGLLSVNYEAPVTNPADNAWIELPVDKLSQCAQRVYNAKDCVENNSASGPEIGLLVHTQSQDEDGVPRTILPTFTSF